MSSRLRPVLWLGFAVALSCVPGSKAPPEEAASGAPSSPVFRNPIMDGTIMLRESIDELAPDSSAVLHVRSNSDATSEKLQGIEVMFFTGRHPHAVAANIVSQVQPGATADTIRGLKMTTQNIGARKDLVMYGMDVRMRCSTPGASGSTMIPLWVHTEDVLGGAKNLVSRTIMVTAPRGLEGSFDSHVAITAEGPIHATRGAVRVYKDMPPGEANPDPIDESSGPGDVVAEGRVVGKEGIALPSLADEEAKPGVLFFSEEDKAIRFRGPDGVLYRVKLEKI